MMERIKKYTGWELFLIGECTVVLLINLYMYYLVSQSVFLFAAVLCGIGITAVEMAVTEKERSKEDRVWSAEKQSAA